jgi:sugar fermentation stimulation protein A
MQFHAPLLQGILVKRYKRFFADVQLTDGTVVTAHCVNTGAMVGLTEPGTTVWICPKAPHSKGRLDFVWMMVEKDNTLIGCNTSTPSKVVKEAIEQKIFPFLPHYPSWRAEIPLGHSRLDFCFYDEHKAPFYVEVKNVHLRQDQAALFPDCVTERGTRHLELLTELAQRGIKTAMLYIVQRQDISEFGIAGFFDLAYGKSAEKALAAGVTFMGYKCQLTTLDITLDPQPLTFKGILFEKGCQPLL